MMPEIGMRFGSLMLSEDRTAEAWKKVAFDPPFETEMSTVIVLPMTQTYKGPETPELRICNVTKTGSEIRLDEVVILADGGTYSSDGSHVPETLGWVA